MGELVEKQRINPTSSQYTRWLRALDPGYARVDDRSYHQLLDFSVQFGALINFYNLEDEVDGDWVDFFQNDPQMVFASIEAMRITDIEDRFGRLQRRAGENTPAMEALREAITLLARLAGRFDAWMIALEGSAELAASTLLRDNLRSQIENGLAGHLNRLHSHAAALQINSARESASDASTAVDFPRFSRVWKLRQAQPGSLVYDNTGAERETGNTFDSLVPILNAFTDALAGLQNQLVFNLRDSEGYARHRPQVALYMAFAGLYRHAQNTINTFSERYVRFYYDEVLKERPRGAVADHVYLNFTLEQDDETYSAPVPATTLFSAGQDSNGNDIIYTADRELRVSAAAIARLRTLNVEKGPLIPLVGQESPPDDSLVTRRIFASEVPLDETGQTDAAWPTFGAPAYGEPASLGFAISSPYLLLTGGEREIKLQMQYSQEYYQQVLQPLLTQLSQATGCPESDIFNQVLVNAFTLFASSASQWFAIQEYDIDFIGGDQQSADSTETDIFTALCFIIRFNLPASAPAIDAYNPEDAEDATDPLHPLNTALPTVEAYLSQKAITIEGAGGSVDVYPISLIGKMTLDAINIFTDVRNLNNLALENTDGEIDPASPFLVFGGTPVVGSYLQILHSELFVKTPDYLGVTVEWFNIPQNDNGFAGYYRYYDIGPNGTPQPDLFNNTTFLGEFGVINPGSWDIGNSQADPPTHGESVYLFRTRPDPDGDCLPSPPEDDKPLCGDTGFEDLTVQPLGRGFPPYYKPEESALRLTLSEPSYAFGNDLYPENVLNAVIRDLPDTDECREKCLCDCRPIEDTVRCLESILENCLVITDPDKRLQCIGVKLAEGELLLITAFIQCLLRCLNGYEGIVSAQVLKKIKDAVNELPQQSPATRQQTMKTCLDAVNALAKTAIQPVNDEPVKASCGGSCDAIYQVAGIMYKTVQCVTQCDGSEDEPGCQEACLLSALKQVQAIYDAALTACMDGCMAPKQELKYPNEPYLPQAVSVRVDYRASCTLFDINAAGAIEPDSDFYHLLPFGGYRRINCSVTNVIPMLPNYTNAGNLYIGLSALITPQLLTLLFQISGATGLELPAVQWDVLSDNLWRALPPIDDVSDSTYGLQNSGIVSLDVPATNDTDNTILSSDYTWLRASVFDNAELFPLTRAIFPHALPASQITAETAIETESEAKDGEDNGEIVEKRSAKMSDAIIPAHTISSSVEDLPNIASINQPMSSFGGRTPETYPEFQIRMGERLRHKDRAIQAWDYERLVLEQFPEIWKVQALSAHDALHADAPGNVLLVVIPGPNCIDCTDPTVPAAPNDILQSIRQTLQKRASPFVQLHVSNPVYVRVCVRISVSFINPEDPGANIDRLNNDLVQYLSPWYYDAARSTRDGDYASEADIASFILNRPYVLTMGSIEYIYEPPPETLEADWYFLTSAPEHDISISERQSRPVTEPDYSY